jgi:hypothetical protein
VAEQLTFLASHATGKCDKGGKVGVVCEARELHFGFIASLAESVTSLAEFSSSQHAIKLQMNFPYPRAKQKAQLCSNYVHSPEVSFSSTKTNESSNFLLSEVLWWEINYVPSVGKNPVNLIEKRKSFIPICLSGY